MSNKINLESKSYNFINKNEDFECLYFILRKASRWCDHHYNIKLKTYGIRATQIHILWHIAMNENQTVLEMSKALGMHRTTFDREALGLIKKEYLSLNKSDNFLLSKVLDKFKKTYLVTEKGMDILEKSLIIWKDCQKDLMTAITGKSDPLDYKIINNFKSILEKINIYMEDYDHFKYLLESINN